jgi:histidyl-tRNA synthetase
LRSKGINAEIYPDNAKLDKQMKYANALQIPFVAFTGDEEMATQQVKIKNMTSGEQQTVNIAQLVTIIS